MRITWSLGATPRSCSALLFAAGRAHTYVWMGERALHQLAVAALPAMFLLASTGQEVYNVLWAAVFGFATLNILSLGARRAEPQKTGLHFGEVLAILVVVVSIIMLGWEMLYVSHILPIHLAPQ